MKNKHLFVDFSMLGYYPERCVILDCSVAIVDAEKMISSEPYSAMKAFNQVKRFKLSIEDQKKLGFEVPFDGVEFWKTQPKDLVNRTLKPSDKDLTVEQFTLEFIEFLIPHGNVDCWWSWNMMDDAAVLWRLFHSVEKENMIREYLPRWKARDVATMIDCKFDFNLKKLDLTPINDQEYWDKLQVNNDSSIDVMSSILRLQAVLRAENDLDMVER